MSETQYTIESIFRTAERIKASDIYLTPNSLPILRVKDQFKKIDGAPLSVAECNNLILSSMTPAQQAEFIENKDFDFALNLAGIGRFRVNVYIASGAYEMVARIVAGKPSNINNLFLPDAIREIADEAKTGLVLVTGATGSGKTSTLAGFIDHINETKAKKIITLEDPVEIVHTNKKSSVSQRELYADTGTFSNALRAAMRQRPDIILIGEMRDAETVSTAIGASESGHLVLSTLHSINAMDTIGRVLDFYPMDEQQQIRNLLSSTLRAIISQKLIVDDEGQVRPLVEILTNSERIKDAIRDPEKTHSIKEIMQESSYDKMQTFDTHLLTMVTDGYLSAERALNYTENVHELRRHMKQAALI